jgi:hypothetical protein
MQPRPALALLLASLVALLPLPARANMAKAVIDGERLAVLSPQGKTAVRVDSETLDFQVSPDLATAAVLATYRMTNAGAEPEPADIVFAYARGDHEDDPSPRAAVQADGAKVDFRVTTDNDPLAPKLADLDVSRLGFLLFHIDFPPGKQRTITVRYEQRATLDREAHVNATSRFEYLLSPAKRWASFGPLDISIRVPPHTELWSPLPLRRDGDARRASLAGLPEGELHFSAMSLDGLWFGMTETAGYWAILIVTMAGAALGVGASTGKRWAARRRWARALLRVFVAGPAAAAASLAMLVMLMSAFPGHALGFGYGGLAFGALLVLLSVPAGAAASFAAAAVHDRARR